MYAGGFFKPWYIFLLSENQVLMGKPIVGMGMDMGTAVNTHELPTLCPKYSTLPHVMYISLRCLSLYHLV